MLPPLKLITFDVTGTILKFRIPVGQQYANIASKYGINLQPDKLTTNFKNVFKVMSLEHPNFGSNDIGWEKWWGNLVEHTIKKSLPNDFTVEENTCEKISSELIKVYTTKECWELAEGAQCLLEKLSRKPIALGVISNYDPRLELILKDLDVFKYFKFIVTSYWAKYEKPHPGIFNIVEDMNKDVKKGEMLHIGDNLKLDYEGAKGVGWNAILVNNGKSESNINDKGCVVKRISDIYGTLEQKFIL